MTRRRRRPSANCFNRFNGGGYLADSEFGEAAGGGAVIEITGLDDFGQPLAGKYRVVVKTYVKPGVHGEEIRRRIRGRPLAPAADLSHAGSGAARRSVRKTGRTHGRSTTSRCALAGASCSSLRGNPIRQPAAEDIVVELDPGMAFGTGLHPSTRLCIAALERYVQPGDAVLDVGTGSGVLSIVAAKLGASAVHATDIDPIAVDVAKENFRINGVQPPVEAAAGQGEASPRGRGSRPGSVPAGMAGRFDVIVANILAEVLAGLLDSAYGNVRWLSRWRTA